MSELPPWSMPADGQADSGGVKRKWQLANHWKQWGAKFRRLWHRGAACPPALCQSDCGTANHGKPWDGKVMGPTV